MTCTDSLTYGHMDTAEYSLGYIVVNLVSLSRTYTPPSSCTTHNNCGTEQINSQPCVLIPSSKTLSVFYKKQQIR